MRRWPPLAAPVLPRRPQFSSSHHSTSHPFRLGIAAFLGLVILFAPGALASEASRGSGPSEVIFLTQIIVLLLVGRLMGEAMQRIGQPAVMGQLIAGLLLGPSVLGALWPEAQHALFPPHRDQKSMIDAVSQLGVLMLLLLTGMETDLSLIRKARRAAFSVSVTGIVIPFACGFALGEFLPQEMLPRPDLRLITSLFLGTALSISSVKIVYHPSEILAAWNVDVVGDLRL
jgi:hypothetical protein